MLYDVPTHSGYKVLTHTSSRRFAKNGFSQVGNTTFPSHPINPDPVKTSSIYNKNLSGVRGLSEAGYGQRDPNHGLSYAGAGSPRASLRYAGAGSPRASLRYAGAGSPKTSLRDAYINDNPPAGTLRGLAEDTPVPVEGDSMNLAEPPKQTIGTEISSLFGSLFSSGVSATESAGATAIQKSIFGSLAPSPSASAPRAASTLSPGTTNILGMAIPTTALLLGGGIAAYLFLKK